MRGDGRTSHPAVTSAARCSAPTFCSSTRATRSRVEPDIRMLFANAMAPHTDGELAGADGKAEAVVEVADVGAVEPGVGMAREEDQHHASSLVRNTRAAAAAAAAVAVEGELGGGELEVEPAHVPRPALATAGELDGDEVFGYRDSQVMLSAAGARLTARTSAACNMLLQRATSEELKLSRPTRMTPLPLSLRLDEDDERLLATLSQ
nr:unnamed protein product [Digitaria exilis]